MTEMQERIGPHTHAEWEEIEETAAEDIVACVASAADDAASFGDQIAPGVVENIIENVIIGLIGHLRDITAASTSLSDKPVN